jgi:glycosyltransferase involved in cell wall biosynthesis
VAPGEPFAAEQDAVTVVVPVRDEEATVGHALESLSRQTIGPASIEVLVYDGGSVDRTAEICRSFADRQPWRRFEVLDNPETTVPHALNSGLAESRCPWFAVLAGRTALSANYLEACLAELRRAGPGVGVGGRFVAQADGLVPRSIAAAVTHRLGVGSGFRTETRAADVPHHPFAVWRREDVIRFGAFDPELVRNQDDAFSMRAARHGARIRLIPETAITYRPRERYRGLTVQYFQYGLWKSAVAVRYGLFPKRSVLPALVAGALPASVVLATSGRTRLPLVALLGSYALGGAVVSAGSRSNPPLTSLALALVHLSYGTGVIVGAVRPGLAVSPLARTRLR